MTLSIARLQASDPTTPTIDLFTRANGVPTNVDLLQFQVFELVTDPDVPAQVFPTTPGAKYTVDPTDAPAGDRLSTGHYVARWTVPGAELLGLHMVRWFIRLTPTSAVQTFEEEFVVVAEVAGFAEGLGYATIQELRDEGVTTAMASDSRLQTLIERCSALIDMYTGRFFEPRAKTIRVDGTGARALLLNEAIVAVDSVEILDAFFASESATLIDASGYLVYNRHLTEGLLDPDDRDSPRLEFRYPAASNASEGVSRYLAGGLWPRGRQNIRIVGTFGYTEPDGSPTGRTPLLIRHATMLMVMRELATLADPSREATARIATSERTRDQAVGYASPKDLGRAAGVGRITGDPEIDRILERFKRVPILGAA